MYDSWIFIKKIDVYALLITAYVLEEWPTH